MRNDQLDELLSEPREALDIEIKDWLDLSDNDKRAALAKEIIALANHGGGFIVAGYTESDAGAFSESVNHPGSLASWSQDCIQDIVEKYSHPTIQLRVYHRKHPASGAFYPIISVPGGHRIPIIARAGSPDGKKLIAHRTYIRRPGPQSAEPQTAEEWNGLLERCIRNRQDELLEAMRSIMNGVLPTSGKLQTSKLDELMSFTSDASGRWKKLVDTLPDGSQARHPHGFHDFAFAIDGNTQAKSLQELRNLIRERVRNFSGWPPFVSLDVPQLAPQPVDGAVQAWLSPEEGTFLNFYDFWRVDPRGFMISRTAFLEDTVNNYSPGKYINVSWTIRSVADAILQAIYIASAFSDEDANLICSLSWEGLKDRGLITHQYIPADHQGRNKAIQDRFQVIETVRLGDAEKLIVEIVHKCCFPLLELFNFYQLDKRLVETEISQLTSRRF
ncbi:UNVERIFIED_ORG: hypothetical protein J2W74_003917 [Methylorubrum zatmanii]